MKYFNTDRIKHLSDEEIKDQDIHYTLEMRMISLLWRNNNYIGVSYTIKCNFIDKININMFDAISNVEGPCPILEIPTFDIVIPVPNTNEHLSCVGYRFGTYLSGVERLKVYIVNIDLGRYMVCKLSRFINYEYNIYYPDAITISKFE